MFVKLPRIPLEDWMRDYYFDCELDLGSSGVNSFSMGELREMTGLTVEEIDNLVFNDSETYGAPELRQAIADRWGDGNAETVLLGHGSNEIGFVLMTCLLEAGDEVVCLDPIYHTLGTLADSLGCKVKRLPLRYENAWQPDLDEMAKLITADTKMVCVNFPHNPTGVSLTPENQKRLVEMVAETGAYLVWDAAFEDLVHVGEPLPNPRKYYDRCLVSYTMSKCYGLPGTRLGWAICPEDVFENFMLLRDFTSLYVSPLVELVGLKAVQHADKLLDKRLEQVRPNLARLTQWIEDNEEYVDWVPPMGGVTGFVRIKGVADTDPFCRELVKQTGVMLVPGRAFNNPSHVRLGFGGPVDEFETGLNRLTDFLRREAKNFQTNQ